MSYWKWLFGSLKSLVELMLSGPAEASFGVLIGVFASLILRADPRAQVLAYMLSMFAFLLFTHGLYRVERENKREIWEVENVRGD